MDPSTSRYSACFFFQILAMSGDLVFNCMSLFPRSFDALLLLFIFQDLFLVLSLFTNMMMLFSTYLFQAGLIELLVRKFRTAVAVCTAYVVASVVLHLAWLFDKWEDHDAITTPLLIFLFTVQRVLSPLYYFFSKRTALRVSDPRFYEDIDWINRQLRRR